MQLGMTPPNTDANAVKNDVVTLISLAACSLLSGVPAAAVEVGEKPVLLGHKWSAQTAIMSYSEDGRINVNQALFKVSGTSDTGSYQLKMGYDVVSGPSENGAMPSEAPQTFTSPSGAEDYTVDPNTLPQYVIERHPRKEISIDRTKIVNSDFTVSAGARYSTEATYESRSANFGVIRNTNKKNTQLSVSASYEDADVTPYSGAVIPRSLVLNRTQFATEDAFLEAWQAQRPMNIKTGLLGNTRTEAIQYGKKVWALSLGVSQIINKNALAQFNYSYGQSNGFQNDVQKMVSIVDEGGGVVDNIYENRPDNRDKQTLFGKVKYSTSKHTVLDVHYRYYWDNWDIASHTYSAGLQIEVSDRLKVEPQIRIYKQSRAFFFRHSLFEEQLEGDSIPRFLSADYRLAATTNYTYGLNFDYKLENDKVASLRLAMYNIKPEESGEFKRGYLNTVDVLPEIKAVVLALSYEF